MAFCSKCGTQSQNDAAYCGSCGTVIGNSVPQINVDSNSQVKKNTFSLENKFHITLIVSASIATLLLYTTSAVELIGVATGLCFGLSVRLFVMHKKNNFKGTKKLDWILVSIIASIALLLCFAGEYSIQGLFLIFLSVRTLMMYFTINSSDAEK